MTTANFDGEFSTPKNRIDKMTLARYGWRKLTDEEAEEYAKKKLPEGTYPLLATALESGMSSLRYYKDSGVCLHVKPKGCGSKGMYFPLSEEEKSTDLSLVKFLLDADEQGKKLKGAKDFQ
jgi:hypothetical protein